MLLKGPLKVDDKEYKDLSTVDRFRLAIERFPDVTYGVTLDLLERAKKEDVPEIQHLRNRFMAKRTFFLEQQARDGLKSALGSISNPFHVEAFKEMAKFRDQQLKHSAELQRLLGPTLRTQEHISDFLQSVQLPRVEPDDREDRNRVKSQLPTEVASEIDGLSSEHFRFYAMGFNRAATYCVKTVYAQFKFKTKDFEAVDKLIRRGYRQKGALDEVAEKRGFNRESFEKQYRTRHQSKKVKGKGSSPRTKT